MTKTNCALSITSFLIPLPTFSPSPTHHMPVTMTDEQNCDSDVILAIRDPDMDQIVCGDKNYEFRKYRLKPTVKRIWFYRTASHCITHVCDASSARTRNPGDTPLEEDGLGNFEFNNRHPDWDGYDFAYKMITVRELCQPITLGEMKESHGFKFAPRGLVYLLKSIGDIVDLDKQKLVLDRRIEI